MVLRSFLDADEREWIGRRLDEARFHPHTIEATGKTELLMEPNAISALLLFKLCDPEVFDLVERVTGSCPVGYFRGRTYRMVPGAGHFSPWHDDAVDGRLAAFTINLSPQPFDGARLQVKSAADDELLTEIGDLDFGDAVLIQISRAYQHRNSPLLGTAPKTSYAGFFYPGEPSPLARR
ncbi:MAG TPA: hypothetical protein VF520_04905 [Thermoleophilaceae bacterium]